MRVNVAAAGSDGTIGGPGGTPVSTTLTAFGLAACQAVATSNVSSLNGLQTIDGYTLQSGDRILLTGQGTASQNGVWQAAVGAWIRPTDFSSGTTYTGSRKVDILTGSVGGGSTWLLGTSPCTVDTTSQTWQLQVAASVVVVKQGQGQSPGRLGYKTLPQDADYMLSVVGSGVGAINTKTGNTDYSVASGDMAGVVNSAINNLLSGGGPTGGLGGCVKFDGILQVASQIVLFPNVTLRGSGQHGYFGTSAFGSLIDSTFNGACILIQQDTRQSTFPHLADFNLTGNSGTTQDGVGFAVNGTGRGVWDTVVRNVGIFSVRYGYNVNGTTNGSGQVKLFCNNCYVEGDTSAFFVSAGSPMVWVDQCFLQSSGNCFDGGSAAGGFASIRASNLLSSSGVAVVPVLNGDTIVTGNYIANCQQALTALASVSRLVFSANEVVNTGTPSLPGVSLNSFASNTVIAIIGNVFSDSRGASAVTNHISLAPTGNVDMVTVSGNTLRGQQGDAIIARLSGPTGNQMLVKGNGGYNDTKGIIANPFGAGHIGVAGSAAAPAASTGYFCMPTDLFLSVSGGTGVAIRIFDPTGTSIVSGLSTYTGMLPAGYEISFGPFSVAPTVVACVM